MVLVSNNILYIFHSDLWGLFDNILTIAVFAMHMPVIPV